jgi:hypothetical protein
VSVTGQGFAFPFPERFHGGALCRIESSGARYTVPATVINSTLLTCVTKLASTSICSPDIVEVAIYNGYFTINSLQLTRYDDPIISAVRPERQGITSLASVTVAGANLQISPATLCSFTWIVKNASNETKVVSVTNGRGILDNSSTTSIVCDPPSSSVLAGRALVDVACDGTVFSNQSSYYVNFIVSGCHSHDALCRHAQQLFPRRAADYGCPPRRLWASCRRPLLCCGGGSANSGVKRRFASRR